MNRNDLGKLAVLLVLTFAGLCQAEPPAPPTPPASALDELLPLTAGNLRGHRMLYDEGWFVVTSSRAAFAYAREQSLTSSAQALAQVQRDYARHSGAYGRELQENVATAVSHGRSLLASGTELSGDILTGTQQLAKAELTYSRESFQQAMEAFVKGNLTLGQRTAADRRELAGLPGNYYRHLKSDFGNIWELTAAANGKFADKIEVGWDQAFHKASEAFHAEYERSGTQANSLLALGPILSGYLKAFYHGLAAPTAKSIVKGSVKGTTDALFLPVAGATVVAGRTVQAVGLTVYYTGKSGVKLVSPTVEGGLLSGLSLLSLSAVPATYAAGGGLGAMNQVAFTAGAPAYAVGEGVTTSAVDTAKYVSFLAYDSVKGTTRVVINQASSGVVLGYNALTAIPAHLLLGAMDTAVFLAYDGPRLVIVAARGTVGNPDAGASLGELPVGTVVDLKTLQESGQVEVQVLSEEPAVLRGVLEKLPQDLRVAPVPAGKE